jgi:hypothetical protein
MRYFCNGFKKFVIYFFNKSATKSKLPQSPEGISHDLQDGFFLLNPLATDFKSKNKSTCALKYKLSVMKKTKIILTVLLVSLFTVNMYGLTDPASAKPGPVIEPSAMNISIWIFMSWSFFLILISIPFYFNYRRIKIRQQIIHDMIDKGHDIPKELLTRPAVPGRSDFHKGVILIGFGISCIIVLLSFRITNNYWTVGLIPLILGIAYLVSFKFDEAKKKKPESD